jgi:16S rRNA (adenine1518-N6/adenine1519-N6)-dimethyltransferase
MMLKQTLDEILKRYQITPDKKLDQNFLIDENIIRKLISYGHLTRSDRVLEIGAGSGFLTKELSNKAKVVIAIEIDEQFRPILEKLKGNVNVVYADAYKFLDKEGRRKIGKVSKVICNMPFSFVQPILHRFTNWGPDDLIWITPTSFVNKVNKDHLLGAYFHARIIEKIPSNVFFPEPNTILGMIRLERIREPKEPRETGIFIRRQLYHQEDKKLKNALREGLINAFQEILGKRLTKKQAREFIKVMKIEEEELEKLTAHTSAALYFQIAQNVQALIQRQL